MTHYVREDYIFDHKPASQLISGDVFLGGTYGFSQTILEIRPEDDGNGYYIRVQERVFPYAISQWRNVSPDGVHTVFPRRDIVTQMDGETVVVTERHLIIWFTFTNQGWYQGTILREGREQTIRYHKATRTWYLAELTYPPAERQIDIQIAVYGVQPLKPGELFTDPPQVIDKEDLLTKLLPFIGSPLSSVGSFGEKDTWIVEEVYGREDSRGIFAKIVPPSSLVK